LYGEKCVSGTYRHVKFGFEKIALSYKFVTTSTFFYRETWHIGKISIARPCDAICMWEILSFLSKSRNNFISVKIFFKFILMYVTVDLRALTGNGRTDSNGWTIRGMRDERS